MKLPELLAPAGSIECLTAAANAGADAVYMGGTRFGARAYAENPETADFLKAMDKLHIMDKKIYLTLNTLLKDSEMPEVFDFLSPLYENGLDGVIVQDVGVVSYISRHFPKLPIHLSTQMTLNSAAAAETVRALCDGANITRVVPSRELSLEEIRRFRQDTDLEIECFIHGALCYCYSGKCFMSSMFGGRSGNRGRCAQPCRLEYEVNGIKKHYLSPKDMCTAQILPELIEAGIDSFKIEGRMKGYGYVAGVVEGYRRIMDKYAELGKTEYREYVSKNPDFINDVIDTMQELYNRGSFCTGFYDKGAGRDKMSMDRANHNGVKVGTVESARGITASIKLERPVFDQDILEIRDKGKTLYDFTLGTGQKSGILRANFKSGSGVAPGNDVYRTRNNMLLDMLYEDYVKTDKKVKISGKLVFKTGEPVTLSCKCRGTEITVKTDAAEPAKNSPMTDETLEEKIKKTGDTLFEFTSLKIENDNKSFMPVGKLNALRREAMETLERALLDPSKRDSGIAEAAEKTPKNAGYGDETAIWMLITNKNQAEPVIKSKATDVVIDITDISMEEINDLCDLVAEQEKGVYLALPRILRAETAEKLERYAGILRNPAVKGYVLRNLDAYLFIADIAAKDGKEIVFDYDVYAFNREAKAVLSEGASRLTAPIELSGTELSVLNLRDMVMPVYGRMPLMTTVNCQYKLAGKCRKETKDGAGSAPIILKDRMNKEMPHLAHCAYCFSTIHNSDTYTLAGKLTEVQALRPFAVRLDFYLEGREETERAVKAFEDEWFYGKLPGKDFLFRKTAGAFTRGTE